MTPLLAEKLLLDCNGDEIWTLEMCRAVGIPETWIEELADGFESGYATDRQTIYFEGRAVNQFGGCRDVDLALKLAEYLGIDTERFRDFSGAPEIVVANLKAELDEI